MRRGLKEIRNKGGDKYKAEVWRGGRMKRWRNRQRDTNRGVGALAVDSLEPTGSLRCFHFSPHWCRGDWLRVWERVTGGRGQGAGGGDWEVIIGDMLTWQGAYKPKPGTQTSGEGRTHTRSPTHPYTHAMTPVCNVIQQDRLRFQWTSDAPHILTLNTRRNTHARTRAGRLTLAWNQSQGLSYGILIWLPLPADLL